ncbi:MAG: glycosyltransferase [Acetobacteraceae bacterium]
MPPPCASRPKRAASPGASASPANCPTRRWRRPGAARDLFALATEWEPYGTSVAEALRRGLPVAVTAGGAAADAVSPETGVVCPVGDADGLSKALRRLIFDTGLRTDMAQAAWMAGRMLPDWPAQAACFVKAVA